MVWEHCLQLVINLIVGTAMALPRGYNPLRLISIKSLGAYFQLLEVCTQDKVGQRLWGSRGLAIYCLVLEWAAKGGHGKLVLKSLSVSIQKCCGSAPILGTTRPCTAS
jgi:hypothetical protein